MKIKGKKVAFSEIMTLARNDFFGHDALRHWLRLVGSFLKCFVFIGLFVSGCLGLVVLLMMGLVPDVVFTELSLLSQHEAMALMQTMWLSFIYSMLTMALPFSVICAVLITIVRYQTLVEAELIR